MANPTVSGVSLNKTTYAPGETARLKFDVADADTKTSVVTVTVTDSTGATGTGEVTLNKVDVLSVVVTDPDRTWTKDAATSSGNHYEFTAPA